MTNQAPTNDQTPSTPETKDIGELSFTDYQKVRRGEASVESVQQKSAPAVKAEQEPSSESDTEETEEAKDQDDESDADESKAGDPEKDKPKKKGGFQRRIDKLNQRASAAQAEVEYWKEQALKGANGSKANATTVDQPKADLAGKPDPDSFDSHASYVEALTDWKIEQREKVQRAEAQKTQLQTEQEKQLKAHVERVKAFAAKNDDFQEVLEGVDDLPVSPTIQELILSSENGPEIMFELAKNRAEYERINQLAPLAAARELGKIESRLSGQSSAATKPEPKKLTSAPKPIEPVNAGKGAVAKSIDDPNIPFSDYVKLRRQQQKKR